MKYFKLVTVISSIALITFATSAPAAAHILSTHGDIGGVIHLTPDDDPYILEVTEGSIEIKDRSGNFKSSNCDCELVIYRAGKEIYRDYASIRQDDISAVANFNYTFPAKDIYTISLIGKPESNANFSEFELKYDFRITRELGNTEGSQANNATFMVVIGGLMAALLASAYFLRSKNK